MINQMAYIDPASTALIIQIAAGLFITVGVVLGTWWTKLTTFFRGVWVKTFGGQDKEAMSREEAEAIREIEGLDGIEEIGKISESSGTAEVAKPLRQRKKVLSGGGAQ